MRRNETLLETHPVIWVADLRFSATFGDQVYHLGTSGRHSPRTRRASRPAGESRGGAALFGGGWGFPPTPSAPLPTQGSGRTLTRGRSAPANTEPEWHQVLSPSPRTKAAVDSRQPVSGAAAYRSRSNAKASRPAGESREGVALFGGGLGGNPPTPSAPLPAGEAGGP